MRSLKALAISTLLLPSVIAPPTKSKFSVAEKINNYNSKIITINLQRLSHYTQSLDETDSTPNEFSCGYLKNIPKNYHIIALSRDLFFDNQGRKKLCNKKAILLLPNNKILKVIIFDTMHPRYTKTADLLVANKKIARKLGVVKQARLLLAY